MLTAAQILKDLHLGYEKREFASGVVVLQSFDYSDQMVSEKLKEMSRSHPNGLTVFFVSSQLKTNTILAMEQLQTAESMGFLCRDTTIEGVRFFENKFVLW
jgi:ESCRT-II complex subunit VPS36